MPKLSIRGIQNWQTARQFFDIPTLASDTSATGASVERPIKTISFDLWDTILIDDSDEPKRAQSGRQTKLLERREIVQRALERHGQTSRNAVDVAYATADAAFRRVWYSQNVTWSVAERLAVMLCGLGRELPDDEMTELVRLHEEMELEFMPELVPGVADAIQVLATRYKLAVISDAIFSPGRVLREILRAHGLYGFFSAFVFSDEAGCAKPNARLFEEVALQTGCSVQEIVHLGDRQRKDIDGAHAAGSRGILVPIIKDRGGTHCTADAVCRDYSDLPAIIAELER